MTRSFPQHVQQVAAELMLEAGTIFYSVVRQVGVTCSVCATPLSPGHEYLVCRTCEQRAGSGLRVADRVGSLIYAFEPESQAYKVVRNYKAVHPGPSLPQIMRALLALGLRAHYQCATDLSDAASHGWAVVPSTGSRTALRDLVLGLVRSTQREVALRYAGGVRERALRPDDWTVGDDAGLPEHVFLIDDSWVSGSHAQSVAAMLKARGVRQVSIFTVARVISPDFGPNPEFIRTRLPQPSFDWRRCPWTGGDCPD